MLVDGYHARPAGLQRWDQFLAADLGIDPEAFEQQFIRPIYVPEVQTGRKTLVKALEEALPGLGYNGSAMNVLSAWMDRKTVVDQGLIALIEALRANGSARAFIASNQEDVRAYHLWDRLGLKRHFDDMFYSARLGAAKPDPAFFAAVDRHLGPQAEPPLFFDDYETIAAAATAHGWEGVHFDTSADCANHPWIAAQLSGRKAAFIAR